MNVLVAGANGTTGRKIIELLAKTDHHPLGMVRKEEQFSKIKELGGEPVLADLEGSLDEAVSKADAVIFAAGSGGHTGPDKTLAVDRNGAISLIDAAAKNGIKRFVMLSSVGSDSPDAGPDSMKHYLQAKHDADEHLKKSGLNYTIVRPGALSNDEPTGKIIAQEKLEDHNGEITRSDVAHVLTASLDMSTTYFKVFEILNGNVPVEEALTEILE